MLNDIVSSLETLVNNFNNHSKETGIQFEIECKDGICTKSDENGSIKEIGIAKEITIIEFMKK